MRRSYATIKCCSKLYLEKDKLAKYYVNKLVCFANSKHNFSTAVSTKTNNESIKIVEELKKLLSCKLTVAKQICDDFPSILNTKKIPEVRNNVKLLLAYGATVQSIIENPFVLALSLGKTIAV